MGEHGRARDFTTDSSGRCPVLIQASIKSTGTPPGPGHSPPLPGTSLVLNALGSAKTHASSVSRAPQPLPLNCGPRFMKIPTNSSPCSSGSLVARLYRALSVQCVHAGSRPSAVYEQQITLGHASIQVHRNHTNRAKRKHKAQTCNHVKLE